MRSLTSKASQGGEVRCQTILLIDKKNPPVLCSNSNKKVASSDAAIPSLWNWCSGCGITFCLYLFPSIIAWQANLLDRDVYPSFQHLDFHSDINTQEYWNRLKINVPLSSLLGPTHQLLHCMDEEMLSLPRSGGEQLRKPSQWNAGSSLYRDRRGYKSKLLWAAWYPGPHTVWLCTCSPVLPSGWVGAALIRQGWRDAGQIRGELVLHPERSSQLCCWARSQWPRCPTSNTHRAPPNCSQRTGRCSLRCCSLALPGISPVHPCRDNGVFKAETAKEYTQEPLIKATILCTTEHPSRKCTELVPQNNYMCRVLCKHSFYVHQHSWGQCLKIQLCNAFCVVREPFKWYHRFSKITCSSSVSIGLSKETFFKSIIFFSSCYEIDLSLMPTGNLCLCHWPLSLLLSPMKEKEMGSYFWPCNRLQHLNQLVLKPLGVVLVLF